MANINPPAPNSTNIVLFLILIVFLDTTGVAIIIIQIMPRLLKLGATPFTAGCIGSVYGAVQLFSSPIVGSIGDRKDRKYILLGTLLLSAIGYLLLGYPDLMIFTISRAMTGLTKHTHSLTMACISDLVKSDEKGKYFGFFGGAIGAGFIIGPVAGGFLAQLPDGFRFMSFFTTSVFIINSILIWKYLPDMKVKSHQTQKSEDHVDNTNSNGRLTYYLNYLGIENCWDVFLLQGLLEIGMMINFTNVGLVMEEDYGLEPKDLGLFIGGMSLAGVATSALSSKITELCGADRITWYMFGISLVMFIIISFRPVFKIYMCAMLIICMTTTVLRNGWGGLAIQRSPSDKSGKVIGVLHSVAAVAGMLAPLLGGIVTQLTGSYHSTTLVTTLFVLIGFIGCIWFPKPMPKIKSN